MSIEPGRADEVAMDLAASRALDLDLSRIASVALILGPYRNLTTLTASLLALHPCCQVLNHAGVRIPVEADFISSPDQSHLEDFIRYAVHISGLGGAVGSLGGSIRASHAFQREPLRSRYEARFGTNDRKADISAVLWKESMWGTRRLRSGCDVELLLETLAPVRFLLPIRNPLDCARSNARLGMAASLGLTSATPADLVVAILDIIAWFLDWEGRRPDRFTHLWPDELEAERFARLAVFLGLDPEPRWLSDAVDCSQVSGGYVHEPAVVAFYRTCVEERFTDRPEVCSRMLAFVS